MSPAGHIREYLTASSLIWEGAEPLFPNLLMYWHDWSIELILMRKTMTDTTRVELLRAALEIWRKRFDMLDEEPLLSEISFLLEVTNPCSSPS